VIFKAVFHVTKKLEDVQPVKACVEKRVHTFKRSLMINKRRLYHLSSFLRFITQTAVQNTKRMLYQVSFKDDFQSVLRTLESLFAFFVLF